MYFLVADTVVDRDDLNLFEKMACVVLARYANHEAFDGLLSMDIIALKMGVTSKQAQDAIQSLINKGLLAQESLPQHSQAPSMVQKGLENLEKYKFTEIKNPNAEEPQEEIVTSDVIQGIFDEVVPKRQALILYELAGRSLNRLKDAYSVVRSDNHFDLVEALSEYLQDGARTAKKVEKVQSIEKVESVEVVEKAQETADLTSDAINQLFEALEPISTAATDVPVANAQEVKTQINMSRIHALYQQQNKKK